MGSSDEKSLQDFEREPPDQIEPKDFVTDVVIILEPAKDPPVKELP